MINFQKRINISQLSVMALLSLLFFTACGEEDALMEMESAIIKAVEISSSGVVGIEVKYAATADQIAHSHWGDGVIIADDGSIVTTQSLIEGSEAITIMFLDGCHHEGNVVGSDRESNLALLITEAHEHGCFPVKMSTVEAPLTGSIGILIGHNWISKGVSVGMGILSKTWLGGDDFWVDPLCLVQSGDQMIQTGVGVVSSRGHLIGICDNHVTDADGSWTVIPANTIKRVAAKLKQDGKIERGWAGLFCNCDNNDSHASPPPREGGVEILDVVDDSPAFLAGITAGDYIISIDDKPTRKSSDLRRSFTSMKPGQKVEVRIYNKQQEFRDVTLTLTELVFNGDRSRRCSTRSM